MLKKNDFQYMGKYLELTKNKLEKIRAVNYRQENCKMYSICSLPTISTSISSSSKTQTNVLHKLITILVNCLQLLIWNLSYHMLEEFIWENIVY